MIIGLTGKKQSGKDTTGSILVAEHGFVRVGNADALKESAAALFGIDPSWWDEYKNDPNARVEIRVHDGVVISLTVRQFLQRYGTEAHRNIEGFGEDVWVAIAETRAMNAARTRDNIVVTDVRYDNEADLIRRLGGIVVEVYRPELEDDSDTHESEELPEPDMVLWNIDGIEELRERIAQHVRDGWEQSIV